MSTNDPIEEMFRDNKHGLDEKPRDLLWERIEERLDEKSVQKKKVEWWKYVTAASVMVGMLTGVWALFNNPDSVSKPKAATETVYEAPMEINEENASEILDKLEENKQSVVTRDEKKSAPKITENEPGLKPSKAKIISSDNIQNAATYENLPQNSPVPATEMKSAESTTKAKEEVLVFRGSTPEKKDGNYISRSKPETADYEMQDERRLGNSAYPVKEKMTITSDTLVFASQILVKIPKRNILYEKSSSSPDSAVYTNSNIPYPSTIIVTRKNENFQVKYQGNSKYKNTHESIEIQSYVNQYKNNLFYPIDIE